MSKEIIKPVPGYEGRYGVSDQGNVYHYRHKKDGTIVTTKKVGRFNNRGYYRVHLIKNNEMKEPLVHRLVAQCFLPAPDRKLQVNHINGIKTDNRVCNLEWVTPSENKLHSCYTLHQTIKPVALVHNGRVKHVFPSAGECIRKLGDGVTSQICRNRNYHGCVPIFIPYRLYEIWKRMLEDGLL